MELTTLRTRTRRYVRDTAAKRFSTEEIDAYLNEGVDRLRSYSVFANMPYLNVVDPITYLPEQYHYILTLYAASRCFGVDNDFYQEQQKRNEFENAFADLVVRIESGDISILNGDNEAVDPSYQKDYVVDEYFNNTTSDDEEGVIE